MYASLSRSVDQTIAALITRVQPGELRDALSHCAYGGKRVRPLLTMLSSAACGGSTIDALHAATAIELLHTSSLVHDDIMDSALTRRGLPAAHSLYGNSMAILAGDTLIALAFQLLRGINSINKDRIVVKFTNAFLDICEGQGYDLALSGRDMRTMYHHRKMVEKKTARLMEAAAEIGGMIATTNEGHIQALARFGYELGMAFQAKDDLLDAMGDEKKLGKPVKADQHNGKVTFLSLVSTGNEPHDLPALAGAVSQLEEYTNAACLMLDTLPPTPAREQLRSFAESLCAREE